MRCLSLRCSIAGPVRLSRADAVAAFRAMAGPRALVQARLAGMREGFALATDFATEGFPSLEAETAFERRLQTIEIGRPFPANADREAARAGGRA